jgi:hypothetical protein
MLKGEMGVGEIIEIDREADSEELKVVIPKKKDKKRKDPPQPAVE